MAVDTTLRVHLYTIEGYFVTNLEHLIERKLTMTLNDVDSFEFSAYLDDPQAAQINPVGEFIPEDLIPNCVIKVWRDIDNVPGYDPLPGGTPFFCGYVGSRVRNANANTATYTVYSPYWFLQHRFHVDPHDFTAKTGIGYSLKPPVVTEEQKGRDPSEIMAIMIGRTAQIDVPDLIQPYTGVGMVWGTFTGGGKFLSVDPDPCEWADYYAVLGEHLYVEKRYERGQNTWELISDIIEAPGMPDLWPYYFHVEGSRDMMRFNTMLVRGKERNFTLDYNMGPSSNLEDISEQQITDPGSYATHVSVQGQGDRTVDKTNEYGDGLHRNFPYLGQKYWPPTPIPGNDPDPNYEAIQRYGFWQRWEKLDNATDQRERRSKAIYVLSRSLWAPTVFTPTLSPAFTYKYPVDFDVGDTVKLRVNRNAMQVGTGSTAMRKRISSVSIAWSENDMETLSLELVDDYEGIVKP